MSNPAQLSNVRLDELIESIKNVHPDALDIGLAHLVLGLAKDPEGLAARAIVAQGISLEAVRTAATASLPPGQHDVPALIPFDADAKQVLEQTFQQAIRLGHDYVGTEHILFALLAHEGGSGLLSAAGVDRTAAEAGVAATLAAVTPPG